MAADRPPARRPPGATQRRAPEGALASSFNLSTPPDGKVPVVAEPRVPGLAAGAWLAAAAGWLQETLAASGAVLLRGFAGVSEERMPELTRALAGEPLPYLYRSTPRTQVGEGIYTATEYPAGERIPQHNENSYQAVWPLRLLFLCVQPAESGGETPLADSRRVLARLSPDLVARFRSRGVRYVRNYSRQEGEGLDLPWTTVFQTSSRTEVEDYCRAHGIAFEWRGGDRLRTWQTRPAVVAHPRTGEPVWFNQAHLFHVSSLPEPVRASLLDLYAEEDLPRNACFGDGSPLPAEDLDEIRSAMDAETVAFPWQRNDLLLLDNMLMTHGRMPFSGRRRVLVAMGDFHQGEAG